nr:hypothetical protein [Treponema denticola]
MSFMKRKKLFILCLILFIECLVFSCQPALGSSWYNRSVGDRGDNKRSLTVKSIKVGATTLYPEENGEDFIGKVNVQDAILDSDVISASVVDNRGIPVKVTVTIKGKDGQAALKEGESVTVPIRIIDEQNPAVEVQKFLFLEQDSSINNGSADYNPKDPHGNKKFIVKIKTETEEVDPWVYYKEGEPDERDTDNFNSNKFNEWVVYINGFNNADNVASYKFKEGSWTGTPDTYAGQDFGSWPKTNTNVKFYRYKTRKERWSQHGGYTPTPDPEHEDRFFFYRFTSKITIGDLDNSMFCVDRYSKFLFYYSDPMDISSVGVTSNWRDYAQPSENSHTYFPEPFYMTDPVGFVKEDGSVVLYDWIKKNIKANNYHAQKNPAFKEPAEKKSFKPGYSPYIGQVKATKKNVTKDTNPKYTAVKPVISEQPKDGYAKLNSPELVFEVKTEPVPDGETISYQWYKADTRTGAGTKIDDATESSYKITDTSTETKCYFYCIVKNTNTGNNKSEQTESERAKCHITDGQIESDALNPEITEQPKGKTLRLNSTERLTLRVKAKSKDDGTLSYQWYKAASSETEGTAVTDADKAEYTFTPDTSAAGITYYYCLVTNTNNTVQGEQSANKKSVYAAIEIEESYKVEFSVLGEEGGTLAALHNGKPIKSGAYIKKGEQVKFIATPEPNSRYKVKKWFGVPEDVFKDQDKTFAVLTVESANLNVSVSFITMFLKITPKIHNESLQSWSTADGAHINHKYIDGVHLAHDLAVTVNANGGTDNIQWKYDFPIEGSDGWFTGITNGGRGEYVKEEDFVKINKYKDDNNFVLAKDFSDFSEMNILFKTYLIKSNRHDFWRTEKTWAGGGPVYRKQVLDNNSIIKLVYNETIGKWSLDAAALQLNQPERVNITYDQNFTLSAGEEKDFVITYTVNNPDTKSEGTIKVIYTISWK